MDKEAIIREWFFRLPKGYAEPPYTKTEMNILHKVLEENGMNGSVFVNEEIERLQKQVAEKLGYKLVDHRLELYGSKIKK